MHYYTRQDTVKDSWILSVFYLCIFLLSRRNCSWDNISRNQWQVFSSHLCPSFFKVSDASSYCHCPRWRTPNLTCYASSLLLCHSREVSSGDTCQRASVFYLDFIFFASVKYARMSLQSTDYVLSADSLKDYR